MFSIVLVEQNWYTFGALHTYTTTALVDTRQLGQDFPALTKLEKIRVKTSWISIKIYREKRFPNET